MRFRDGSDKATATMQLSCPGLTMVPKAGFTVMTLRQTNNPPNGKVQTHRDRQRKTSEDQSQEHAHHFLRHKVGTSWQAKQQILHTTVTFYGDCVKMSEDFAPNFGAGTTVCCITTHRLTLPFSPGTFPLE
jgi:hypothetical protein